MIIDQLPLLASAQATDEIPIERGVTTYKTALSTMLAVANSDTTSPMDGTAAIGSSTKFARQDHRHPTDTSRASQSDMTTAQGDISALQTGKADANGFKAFTVTLLAASWSSNEQTISNANFLASGYAFIVSPASGSFTDYGTAQIYADDVTTDGSMTFHCSSVPTSDLTVNIARTVAT